MTSGILAEQASLQRRVLVAYERQVRWFNWQVGEDREIMPDDDGILRSLLFSGLWLDPVRFWEGDVAGLLALLQQGAGGGRRARQINLPAEPETGR